jgi:hypothetical protein
VIGDCEPTVGVKAPDDKLGEATLGRAKMDCLVASLLAMTTVSNDREGQKDG